MSANRPLRIDASMVVAACATTIVLLAIGHVLFQWLRFERGLEEVYGFVRLFDLAAEANLPSFFSSAQIVVCAVLAAVIGAARRGVKDPYAPHWLFLAVILLAMGVDEAAEIHELTIRPMRELFPSATTGLLFWGWVMPAGALVVIVGVSYLRFVFSYLPAPMRNACLIGAALFVGGAIGVEMPEARHFQQHGDHNLSYAMFVLVEESMEMFGMLVFMRGLLHHLANEVGSMELSVVATARVPASSRREPQMRRPAEAGLLGALPARHVGPGEAARKVPVLPATEMRADVRKRAR